MRRNTLLTRNQKTCESSRPHSHARTVTCSSANPEPPKTQTKTQTPNFWRVQIVPQKPDTQLLACLSPSKRSGLPAPGRRTSGTQAQHAREPRTANRDAVTSRVERDRSSNEPSRESARTLAHSNVQTLDRDDDPISLPPAFSIPFDPIPFIRVARLASRRDVVPSRAILPIGV